MPLPNPTVNTDFWTDAPTQQSAYLNWAAQKNMLGQPNASPADQLQTIGNTTTQQASNAYLANLGAMAPNQAAMQMGPQIQAAQGRVGDIGAVGGHFTPMAGQAAGQQAAALGALQQTAAGNGPSVAALQQQQGLGQAQQGAAQAYNQAGARNGGSAANQFLASLGAQQGLGSQAVGSAAQGRLGEMGAAGQAANTLAGQYTSNLGNTAALNTRGAIGTAKATNGLTGLQAQQSLAADASGNSYLAGLGSIATGGRNATLQQGQNNANFNNSMTSGIGAGVGAYMQGSGGGASASTGDTEGLSLMGVH